MRKVIAAIFAVAGLLGGLAVGQSAAVAEAPPPRVVSNHNQVLL
ncbi:hypothetical protein [Tenggerimyces flavus]|uniref:Uncharacterized protein n=1 Tax=Tenggerimyces flavus TaxID=1708749 RepID=A0ABV7YNU5_9ACTN|nr:hypothetical protein [Tenggerimyces flavus]MBM7783851.1 Spy/CpxP family protein refolding chaperone [Tenggerimyces flavus]